MEEIPAIKLMALKAGSIPISVFTGFEPYIERDKTKGCTHFVFRTDNIDQTYNDLSRMGLVFENKIVEAPGFVRFISTIDPGGNIIEICEYLSDPLAGRI